MVVTVTPVYAGLLAMMFVALSIRVIGQRRRARIGLGDGGDRLLIRRRRAHANFAEYVPMTIVLMALAEGQASPGWTLHAVGICLLLGRVVHAWGLSREPEPGGFRVLGMALTFTALISAALLNLGLSIFVI